jgi:hypothetical protein
MIQEGLSEFDELGAAVFNVLINLATDILRETDSCRSKVYNGQWNRRRQHTEIVVLSI